MVALTFDDGPGVYTHYAIKKLSEAHLHATFFLVGKEIVHLAEGLAQREGPHEAFRQSAPMDQFPRGAPVLRGGGGDHHQLKA